MSTSSGTNGQIPVSTDLYAQEPKIYPRKISGRFQRLRVLAVWVLLGLYYVLPWVTWDGRQAVLFDLPARKFYLFGLVFWPQDFVLLTGLLVIAALSLFFFTALAGRLWCGYACPQTVWTEVFIAIERFFEGDRNQQIKLDKMPWTREKILKKGGKHVAWIVFALFTGYTFVGYFSPIRELTANLWPWNLGPWETFWIFFYSFATWGNAGFLREQICKYMCPYARFQGAMFDPDTLIISYDKKRGEPRGKRKRNADPKALGLGDCIDCELCVQVCPTGIDIRDGLQYECIACAACIDACDSVMDKMGYPRGLIKYTTETEETGQKPHIIRPRTIMYFVIWVSLIAAWIFLLTHRAMIDAEVLRDRNRLYVENDMGLVENIYTLKVANKTDQTHKFKIRVIQPKTAHIKGNDTVVVPAGKVASAPVRVEADPGELTRVSQPIVFELVDEAGNVKITAESRFIGPRLGR
ncbi:MAG: cytochrome c oxidase accessory protein CcoG [Gammaproteobacteria bacterium]|nr:MAG: cytochrome c oxidase accessory protein CcoG [Gammaproteobacteria bacterium]